MNNYYYDDNHWGGGGGVGRIYVGAPYQRGSGIGSFLGGVFRYVLPLIKRSAKAVSKEALNAGLNIAADVGENNKPFKEAFQARVRESGSNLQRRAKEKLDKFMNGDGYRISRHALPSRLVAALDKTKKKKKRKRKNQSDRKKVKKTKKKFSKKKVEKKRRKKTKKNKKSRSEFVDIFQ